VKRIVAGEQSLAEEDSRIPEKIPPAGKRKKGKRINPRITVLKKRYIIGSKGGEVKRGSCNRIGEKSLSQAGY